MFPSNMQQIEVPVNLLVSEPPRAGRPLIRAAKGERAPAVETGKFEQLATKINDGNTLLQRELRALDQIETPAWVLE